MTPTTPTRKARSGCLPLPASTPFAMCGCLMLMVAAVALTVYIQNLRLATTAFFVALSFAAAVLALRAATVFASICGFLIAFITAMTTGVPGFMALTILFVLTWTSTRLGRERKQHLGTAENRRGRQASQVFANLGTFALLAAASMLFSHGQGTRLLAGAAAALAEAAGDTASSE